MEDYKKQVFLDIMDKIKADGGYGLQVFLSKDNDGTCPCFWAVFKIDGKEHQVHGRCWRVSENAQDLHFFGHKVIGEKIKEVLDSQEWYNPYTIIHHRKEFLHNGSSFTL